MTTETLLPSLFYRDWDNNGNPLVNGLVYTYAAGTSTPLATYTDSTGSTPNANPVVLNSRGEASIWIPPNVGYKFVVTDSAGNQIRVKDQVTNQQLLTLYAGVDTGIANAYVLNFTANFSAYTDGIVLYWWPAHTNTGASTVNVNGLGVVNIVNNSGGALLGGQIVANQATQMIYKGGSFYLIAASIYTLPPASKSADTGRTATITAAADPDLQISVANAGTYAYSLKLDGYGGSGGLAVGMYYTGTFDTNYSVYDGLFVTNGVMSVAVGNTLTNATTGTNISIGPPLVGATYLLLQGTLIATTAGTFGVTWSQATSTGVTTYVRRGSWLTISKVA